jgi:hypothetical protein
MKIKLIGWPNEDDWNEVKRRALITEYGKGLGEIWPPASEWRYKLLRARHSPIRYLRYSFMLEGVPGTVATHLARHVHAQPYISSLRNDRQNIMDGDLAPRNTPVNMIYDVNAEELMNIANKRLCNKAAKKTREVVAEMCRLAIEVTPELEDLLVSMCEYLGGNCPEMKPCYLEHEK